MFQRIREAKKNESGFTLIELLIVIVILGILAAVVVFSVSGLSDHGNVAACEADVTTVTTAGEAYIAKDANGLAAQSQTVLVTDGFLHSPANDVTYTWNAATPTTFTAVGASNSKCPNWPTTPIGG